MKYISAPLRALIEIFKSLTMLFLIIKLLENFVVSDIKITNLDTKKEG
mgnify:CR=1 FL=1|tara:strand:+ start:1623 stop:1766 length:144 start_codon:yes stop_codon:yes gene_type:complete